ncbi:MAG: tripartite tricarboxylate transporter permease [Alphaproteobacteria bacterium]
MDILSAIGALFGLTPLFFIALGTLLGIVVGAIPGLTGTMLIALSLPLTFSMTPANALALLVAMYVGAISGGLISATLLRMPGTPASVMTTLDGYPMARSGQPARALGFGISASFFGGCVSWLFLVGLSRPLADLATKFGPFEIFALVMMAIVLIASVSEGSLLKGLISGFLGMLVAIPGVDPAGGSMRLTFGFQELTGGLGLLPVLIGVFAVGQIISDVCEVDRKGELIRVRGKGIFLGVRDWTRNMGNLIRSSLIGTWIGILPGVGANIASIIAYTTTKNLSKTPERFGKGAEEGIIASEAANNASVNGALIPLIAMGIPGSVIDAILLGAMTIHAVTPGALLFVNSPDLVVAIMGSAFIANVLMFFMMVFGAIYFARLTLVPRSRILPVILLFCLLGSYATSNSIFDVWVMLAFGVIGFAMERCKVPLGPFVIGLVLAPIAESGLRSGLMITAGDIVPLFTRPISGVFMAICVGMVIWQGYGEFKRRGKYAAD